MAWANPPKVELGAPVRVSPFIRVSEFVKNHYQLITFNLVLQMVFAHHWNCMGNS